MLSYNILKERYEQLKKQYSKTIYENYKLNSLNKKYAKEIKKNNQTISKVQEIIEQELFSYKTSYTKKDLERIGNAIK